MIRNRTKCHLILKTKNNNSNNNFKLFFKLIDPMEFENKEFIGIMLNKHSHLFVFVPLSWQTTLKYERKKNSILFATKTVVLLLKCIRTKRMINVIDRFEIYSCRFVAVLIPVVRYGTHTLIHTVLAHHI